MSMSSETNASSSSPEFLPLYGRSSGCRPKRRADCNSGHGVPVSRCGGIWDAFWRLLVEGKNSVSEGVPGSGVGRMGDFSVITQCKTRHAVSVPLSTGLISSTPLFPYFTG